MALKTAQPKPVRGSWVSSNRERSAVPVPGMGRRLWRLPLTGADELQELVVPGLPGINNDHVLAPDGRTLLASATIAHLSAPLDGSPTARLTPDREIGVAALPARRQSGRHDAGLHRAVVRHRPLPRADG